MNLHLLALWLDHRCQVWGLKIGNFLQISLKLCEKKNMVGTMVTYYYMIRYVVTILRQLVTTRSRLAMENLLTFGTIVHHDR